MYKCKICNRTYSVKNKYCDCGSSEFEYIETKQKQTPKKTPVQQTKEILSWVIFGVCVVSAIIILFL